jgi:glycosyltransferase involved in cell wall biosynthesis
MCKELARDGVDIDFVLPYQPASSATFMRLLGALPIDGPTFINLGGAYDSVCYACETRDCTHACPSDLRGRQQRYGQYVEQLVRQNDYDAIHAHDWLTFEAGIRAKKITGKPLIAHVHATEFDRAGAGRGNSIVHEIEQQALLMADCIIAISQFTKDLLIREYNIAPDKIEVVHNSIDIESLEALDGVNAYHYLEEMKKHGYKVVVSLGRLTIQKGVYHLLQAAQRVVQQNPKVLFLIAGDGDLYNELLLTTAELGITKNVVFTGFVRGKQWRDAFAIGDMFVMPSVSEPFGLTALEAASYHNAILLSKQSGVGEVLRNVMRFDFWDTEKLANAILAVADHQVLQNMLADGAQQETGVMSWQNATRRFQEIYLRYSQPMEFAT